MGEDGDEIESGTPEGDCGGGDGEWNEGGSGGSGELRPSLASTKYSACRPRGIQEPFS